MSEPFKREERYIVIKRKHLPNFIELELREELRRHSIPMVDCVVVEHDWPEYDPVWAMIESRMAGDTNPSQGMVAKIARAMLADDLSGSIGRDFNEAWEEEGAAWISNARAALTAMLNPTPGMLGDAWVSSGIEDTPEKLEAAWRAMVEAAINGQ